MCMVTFDRGTCIPKLPNPGRVSTGFGGRTSVSLKPGGRARLNSTATKISSSGVGAFIAVPSVDEGWSAAAEACSSHTLYEQRMLCAKKCPIICNAPKPPPQPISAMRHAADALLEKRGKMTCQQSKRDHVICTGPLDYLSAEMLIVKTVDKKCRRESCLGVCCWASTVCCDLTDAVQQG